MALNCYGNRFVFNKNKLGGNFQLILHTSSEKSAESAAKEAYELVDSLNVIFSSYYKSSEINRLNKKKTLKFPSTDLINVLQTSQTAYLKTKGYFNIAILPLVKVWRKAYKNQKLPSKRTLDKHKKYLNLNEVLTFKNEQILLNRKSGLVLGGIAKGYIIDQVYNLLKSKNITAFLIEAAGDIRVFGQPEKNNNWLVGVATENSPSFRVSLKSGEAIATSGKSFRYKWINKKKYSHILNPKSLMPITKDITASVIAKNATTADYLASTFNIVTNQNEIKDIIGNHKDICLLMFNRNGVIFKSENFIKTEI